ncbi:MAG: dihydroorotate dehydrogenase-like protein [bacterium]|nr:dihydroorotate dehydrogenase-like protein [bacterium]
MNLSTTYLGLELKNPIMCGACPLGTNVDMIRQLEDAGISGIVLPSLFEEEIQHAVRALMEMEAAGPSSAEASSYLPDPEGYHVGPNEYLELITKAKEATSIPIIASLNGATAGGWTKYAEKMVAAGADALELNVYLLPFGAEETGASVEERTIEIVRAVKEAVNVPVAVKLSPFFSSLANMSKKLVDAGADGLVLFNRFYQPDIDIEELDVVPNLRLSTSEELRLRLRWLAILSGQIETSLSATGGAHTAVDVIKSIMAGAHTVQMVSALLIHGADHVGRCLEALEFWMKEHDYDSIDKMLGSMNLTKTPNPEAIGRANYMKVLDSWNE